MKNQFELAVRDEQAPYAEELGLGNDTLLVAFAGISGGLGVFPFEFFNIVKNFNVDKIFIRDLRQSWYHSGLPDVCGDIEGIADFVKAIVDRISYKKVVCVGNSMGGYAAIVVGVLINADVVHAFSPQTFLDEKNRNLHKDHRWPDQIAAIPSSTSNKYTDLSIFFEKSQAASKIHIYYSRDERIDVIHAMHVSADNIFRLPYSGGGHQLVQQLKKAGELHRILRNSLSPFGAGRVVAVFKDVDAGIDAHDACSRHEMDFAVYLEWLDRYPSIQRLQGGMLRSLFRDFQKYLFERGLSCVDRKLDRGHVYTDEYCQRWYGEKASRKISFGTCFDFGSGDYLLRMEIGSRDLHVGLVRYQSAPAGRIRLCAMSADEKAKIVALCAEKLPRGVKLDARNWGHQWCSIGCGSFEDLSQCGAFYAAGSVCDSPWFKKQILPLLDALLGGLLDDNG